MKTYKFHQDDFTEEEKQLLGDNRCFFTESYFNDHYLFFEIGRSTCFVFNKEIVKQIIELLRQGKPIDSQEIKELLSIKIQDQLWQFTNTRHSTRPISFAKESWQNKKHLMVEEHEDHYIMYDIPNGEFSDGRPRSYKGFKTLEGVKKEALNYIDKEIENLKQQRRKIEETDVT